MAVQLDAQRPEQLKTYSHNNFSPVCVFGPLRDFTNP